MVSRMQNDFCYAKPASPFRKQGYGGNLFGVLNITKMIRDEEENYHTIVIPSQLVSIQLIRSNLFQTEDAVGGKLEDVSYNEFGDEGDVC